MLNLCHASDILYIASFCVNMRFKVCGLKGEVSNLPYGYCSL